MSFGKFFIEGFALNLKEMKKMGTNKWYLVICLALGVTLSANAQEKVFKYEGAASCKMCHMTPKSGAAYKIWQASKHAKAYATLASEEAKAIGKKLGIADPQKSEKCLSCHVTAAGVDAKLLGPKYSIEEGVGCESCHGPGSEYKSKKVMDGLFAKTIEPASVGLILPTEENCKKCHNDKSPTFKGFDFEKMKAQIAHPVPKGEKKG